MEDAGADQRRRKKDSFFLKSMSNRLTSKYMYSILVLGFPRPFGRSTGGANPHLFSIFLSETSSQI